MALKKLDLATLKIERTVWKTVCEDALDAKVREIYLKRKEAVDMYIDGHSLLDIYNKTGIDKSLVVKLTQRCAISVDSYGENLGYTSLLPYKRVSAYQRVANTSIDKGQSGTFSKLLSDFPHLKNFIENQYFRKNSATLEKVMSIKVLHHKFMEECRRLGIQDYEYPFYTNNKAYKSLRLYVHSLEQIKSDEAIKREGKDIRKKYSSVGFGKKHSAIPLAPYSTVQLDGHKIDALYTVEVENEKGERVHMPATRMWLIAVIDTATRVILGYSLTREDNYNQTDVLRAIQHSIVPHRCMKFTIGNFKYPENGGFPSTAIKETEWALFDEIMLDNAKAHLALNVVDKITNKLRCAVNFGSVATPETRNIVERVFRTLEENGFHRLPSTTGSNSKDTKRENAEKDAIKYKIVYNDLVQLIEYMIALYNSSPHSALDNMSPLECMERRIKEAKMTPYLADEKDKEVIYSLTHFTCTRTVRGGYKKGKKPFVNYQGTEYRNDIISLSDSLVGKTIILEINPEDISRIKAYFSDGSEIGYLTAVGEWSRKSHSLRTRKAALKFARENGKNKDSLYAPLSAYEEELKERSKKQRKARTKAAILKNEQISTNSIEENNHKDIPKEESAIKIKSKMESLSEEQLELLMSTSSIEEAFNEGVF